MPSTRSASAAVVVALTLASLGGAQEPSPAAPPFSADQTAKMVQDLQGSDPDAKWRAALSLGLAREAAAVEPVARLFDEPRWQFWEAAAWALGNIGGPRAAELLQARLQEDKHAAYAAPALAALGERGAVPGLVEKLQSASVDARGAAAQALGRLKDPRAVAPLVALTGDKSVFTDRSGIEVVWDAAEQKPKAKSTMSGRAIHKVAAQALVQIADRSALPPLEQRIAAETDAEVRKVVEEAIEELRKLPTPAPSPAPTKKPTRRRPQRP